MTTASANVIDVKSISPDHQQYAAWTTVARCANGRLVAVASAGRLRHADPFGQVHFMESDDDGENWSRPRVLVDGPLDDRDAGILETRDGTLVVNWFTSIAALRIMDARPEHLDKLDDDERRDWHRIKKGTDDATIRRELGGWVIRSTDGGRTWSPRVNAGVGSPHGPTQLADGRLLFPGNKARAPEDDLVDNGSPYLPRLGVSVSDDDGATWRWLSDVPAMDNHTHADYHEPHAVQAADGRIVYHVRNHAEPHKHEILQTVSHDGGETWSPMRSLGHVGFPPHLLRLRDDRLLCTYGYRREPYGIRAIVSDDCGDTWSDPITLTDDAVNGDIGYPSTVELADGRLLTHWYERRGDRPWCGIVQARWRLA